MCVISVSDPILVTAEMLMMQPMCTGHPYARRDGAAIQKTKRILGEIRRCGILMTSMMNSMSSTHLLFTGII